MYFNKGNISLSMDNCFQKNVLEAKKKSTSWLNKVYLMVKINVQVWSVCLGIPGTWEDALHTFKEEASRGLVSTRLWTSLTWNSCNQSIRTGLPGQRGKQWAREGRQAVREAEMEVFGGKMNRKCVVLDQEGSLRQFLTLDLAKFWTARAHFKESSGT